MHLVNAAWDEVDSTTIVCNYWHKAGILLDSNADLPTVSPLL